MPLRDQYAMDGINYSSKFFWVFANYDALPPRFKQRLNTSLYQILHDTKPDNEYPTILISHSPPFGCNADVVRKGLHVGSLDIRKYLEEGNNIEAMFSGHIH